MCNLCLSKIVINYVKASEKITVFFPLFRNTQFGACLYPNVCINQKNKTRHSQVANTENVTERPTNGKIC